MSKLETLMETHWPWAFVLVGGVLLLGAVFGWGFATEPTRWEDRYRFHFIPWRVKMGVGGAVLVVAGVVLWLLR